jgi:hypothetical protein
MVEGAFILLGGLVSASLGETAVSISVVAASVSTAKSGDVFAGVSSWGICSSFVAAKGWSSDSLDMLIHFFPICQQPNGLSKRGNCWVRILAAIHAICQIGLQ